MISSLSTRIQDFVQGELQEVDNTRQYLNEKVSQFENSEKDATLQTLGARDEMNTILEEIKTLREEVKQRVGEGLNGLSAAAGRISAGIINELDTFHTQVRRHKFTCGRSELTLLVTHLLQLNRKGIQANIRRACQTSPHSRGRSQRA